MQPVQGIHHITAFAKDPQVNAGYYHEVLGQRLVKTTVNFDDPGTYHLYYGDEVGTPGTIMTFFPWRTVARGQRGNGEVAATAYAVRPEALDFWRERLDRAGTPVSREEERFGQTVLVFEDPEGTSLELVGTDESSTIAFWADGPVGEEEAIRGFFGATLWLGSAEPTAAILTEQMGYQLVGREGNRWRYAGAGGDIGLYIDLLERPGEPAARFGAGSIHHIAYRTVDDDEQLQYLRKLRTAGQQVTPVRDRQYFHSIYFREPGGVLFEIATDAPGFPYDEPVPELGTHLKLPDWYEPKRGDIEPLLPRFVHPATGLIMPLGEEAEASDEPSGRHRSGKEERA